MDKISDLIEGAIISGRVRQKTLQTVYQDGKGYKPIMNVKNACRFEVVNHTPVSNLCPMQVALMEKTGEVRHASVQALAHELGISYELADTAANVADNDSDNLIEFFRSRGL